MTNTTTTIPEKGFVVVLFTLKTCGPCKVFKPIFESVAKTSPVPMLVVDAEEEPQLADVCLVQSVPHLAVIKDGNPVSGYPGLMDEATLRSRITMAMKF